MRKFMKPLVPLLALFSLTLLGSGTAVAVASSSAFDYHAGDGFGPLSEPDVAQADNGDTLTVQSTGMLDAGAKTASGTGTFEHRNAGGALLASGTFAVTGLTTFQFYGCGVADGVPIPSNLCGGRATMPVHVTAHPASGGTVELNAILEVNCVLGQNPPNGFHEGIRVNVLDLINFNKSVSGETVFVAK